MIKDLYPSSFESPKYPFSMDFFLGEKKKLHNIWTLYILFCGFLLGIFKRLIVFGLYMCFSHMLIFIIIILKWLAYIYYLNMQVDRPLRKMVGRRGHG